MNWNKDILKKSSFDNYHWVQDHHIEQSGYELVAIKDVNAFDEGFKKYPDFYIGPNGTGASIGIRYEMFKKFLETHDEITAPNVHVQENGAVSFGDGRHRYAVMRDLGLPISVSMNAESIENARINGYI